MGCRCKEGQPESPLPPASYDRPVPANLMAGFANPHRPTFYFFIRKPTRSAAIDAGRKLRIALQKQPGNDKVFFPFMPPRQDGNEWVVALPFQYNFDCGCKGKP